MPMTVLAPTLRRPAPSGGPATFTCTIFARGQTRRGEPAAREPALTRRPPDGISPPLHGETSSGPIARGEGAAVRQGGTMRRSLCMAGVGGAALLLSGCMAGPLQDNPIFLRGTPATFCDNPVYVPLPARNYGAVFEKILNVLT